MNTVKMRLVEQEILSLFRACRQPMNLTELRAYHGAGGSFYLWRDDLVLRAAVAYRKRSKRVYIDLVLAQANYKWCAGAESDLLESVIEEAQGKPIVAYCDPDDCDLREWLADQGFVRMARSPKGGIVAMLLEPAKSNAVAERLARTVSDIFKKVPKEKLESFLVDLRNCIMLAHNANVISNDELGCDICADVPAIHWIEDGRNDIIGVNLVDAN